MAMQMSNDLHGGKAYLPAQRIRKDISRFHALPPTEFIQRKKKKR